MIRAKPSGLFAQAHWNESKTVHLGHDFSCFVSVCVVRRVEDFVRHVAPRAHGRQAVRPGRGHARSVLGSWVKPCGTRRGIRKCGKGASKLPKILVVTYRQARGVLGTDPAASAAAEALDELEAAVRGLREYVVLG